MSLKVVWTLVRDAGKAWMDDSSPRLGAALSYYTVFAISPLFIIVIFVASLWFSQDTVRAQLFGELSSLVGQRGAATLQQALEASTPKEQGMVATTMAISFLLLTSTGLFMELQAALNIIFGVESKSGQGVKGFVTNRILSFAMVVGIGFLLLVSLVVSAALSATAKYVTSLVPGMDVLWMVANWLVSFSVITLLFAMIYKVLPDVRIAWRDVWIGAAITAGLFTAGKFLLGLYLGKNAAVSAYGAAGSVILLLLWVYYSAQIMFFGAEVTQLYANRFGTKLQPKAHARWRVPPVPDPALAKNQCDPPPRDRRQELVEEIREEVNSMREVVARRKAPAP